MAETFYRRTTNGLSVSVSPDFESVSITQTASVRDSSEAGHLPFVSVALFMVPDEARELAALLLDAVAHASEKGRR